MNNSNTYYNIRNCIKHTEEKNIFLPGLSQSLKISIFIIFSTCFRVNHRQRYFSVCLRLCYCASCSMSLLQATLMRLMPRHISFHSTCAKSSPAKSSSCLLLRHPSPTLSPPSVLITPTNPVSWAYYLHGNRGKHALYELYWLLVFGCPPFLHE